MPLDQGAAAPRTLTQWIEHLKRSKIAARKTRATIKKRRAITERRLDKAETIIKEIADSGDIIGQRTAVTDEWPVTITFVLLALEPWAFRELCEFGSELTDDEDTHDREPEVDEHTLGRSERLMQPEEASSDDGEPSLGATQMVDQSRWHDGPVTDLEGDPCDRGEPDNEGQPSLMPTTGADLLGFDGTDREADPCDLGEEATYPPIQDQAIIEDARSRYAAGTGGKVIAVPARDPDGKPGAWLLQAGGKRS